MQIISTKKLKQGKFQHDNNHLCAGEIPPAGGGNQRKYTCCLSIFYPVLGGNSMQEIAHCTSELPYTR
jgi:hypothetical protein